ncbi:hypothetical protein HGM15179_001941 [Zosterops borbonicus]|uniref:Uncharacterized protein n=1 Tax=Zosterops borbonicus TaxID=364589 RepID=A0A8K1GW09_9PASS|nr:hypothetical protein HGM15179_001941 [Zosterops borbonicus]
MQLSAWSSRSLEHAGSVCHGTTALLTTTFPNNGEVQCKGQGVDRAVMAVITRLRNANTDSRRNPKDLIQEGVTEIYELRHLQEGRASFELNASMSQLDDLIIFMTGVSNRKEKKVKENPQAEDATEQKKASSNVNLMTDMAEMSI